MAMDSQRAVIGSEDARALIFDMHSGRLVRSLPPNPGPVTALYVSKMDDFLITAGLNFTSIIQYLNRTDYKMREHGRNYHVHFFLLLN